MRRRRLFRTRNGKCEGAAESAGNHSVRLRPLAPSQSPPTRARLPTRSRGELRVGNQCLQSGKPAASGGRVELLDELLLPVELELVPLMELLLPLVVLGVSLRTCFVTLSQHFAVPVAALGEVVVVVDVWAAAIPMLPASIAAAINPIPVIRMRPILP